MLVSVCTWDFSINIKIETLIRPVFPLSWRSLWKWLPQSWGRTWGSRWCTGWWRARTPPGRAGRSPPRRTSTRCRPSPPRLGRGNARRCISPPPGSGSALSPRPNSQPLPLLFLQLQPLLPLSVRLPQHRRHLQRAASTGAQGQRGIRSGVLQHPWSRRRGGCHYLPEGCAAASPDWRWAPGWTGCRADAWRCCDTLDGPLLRRGAASSGTRHTSSTKSHESKEEREERHYFKVKLILWCYRWIESSSFAILCFGSLELTIKMYLCVWLLILVSVLSMKPSSCFLFYHYYIYLIYFIWLLD